MPFSGFPGSPHPWTYRTYFMASFALNAAGMAILFASLLAVDQFVRYRQRSHARSALYRALSLASPNSDAEDTPQWMVDLDVAESRRESIRIGGLTTAQKCLWWFQCIAVLIFLLGCGLLWVVFCLLSFADSSWVYRWLSVLSFWVVLCACLLYVPSLTFFVVLRRLLPFVTAYAISLCVLQVSTWDFCSPWIVSLVTVVVLFAGAWPLTRDVKLDYGHQPTLHRIRLSFSKHKCLFVLSCVMILAYSVIIPIATAGSCVSFYNTLTPGVGISGVHWSTRLSRSYQPQPCPPGTPCHIYLTVAEDVSTSVYVNVQTHPSVASVSVSYGSSNFANGGLNTTVQAVRFSIPGLDARGDRAVHSVLLSSLTPNTTYYFLVQGDQTMRKFRTGPLDLDPYLFVSGGDIGNTEAGVRTTSRAVQADPLFVVAGGDLAYSNGLRTCYSCWDTWLNSIPTSPEGFTMQILTVPGNHDTGSNSMDGAFYGLYPLSSWNDDNSEVPLFFFMFPHHEVEAKSSPPPVASRKPYHAHKVGAASLFLVLDSGHVTSYQDQVQWLDKQLQDFELAREGQPGLKVATYHVPFYAFPNAEPSERGAIQGKPVWLPIFEKHHVQVAFENHVHAFKRTVPLKNDLLSTNGTVYLGDGYWGISPHDELGGSDEGVLTRNVNGRLAIGGLKYHIWRGEVRPQDTVLNLLAVGHDESPFDNTTIFFKS